jgi:archaellum biogenesis protein FlaJ (TadC family)
LDWRIRLLALSSLAALSLVSAYFLTRGELTKACVSLIGSAAPATFLVYAYRKSPKAKLDMLLVTSIVHMYTVSLGEAGPDDIIRSVAESPEYGFYSRVFSSVRRLAREFGYGFSKAISHVARTVKPPFKDILIRCSEAFSSQKPREFLELEASTIMEEYSGLYTRMVESIRLIGGMFATFQSVSVFIVLTVAVLTIFASDETAVALSYAVAAASITAMFLGFKMNSTAEPLVYVGRNPSAVYRLFRLTLLTTLALTPIPVAAALLLGVPFAMVTAGLLMLTPGVIAYRLESYVTAIDEHYPTFIKALGENMASTSDLKAALEYVLHMELGPLRSLASRASARLKLGVAGETAFSLLASEASSHKIYMFNRIFLDSFRSGGNPLEVGKILGNTLIRFQEFRKRRMSVVKSFEVVVLILQPVTVALLVILSSLCRFFSSMLVSTPYLQLGQIPLDIIDTGNALLTLLITVLNSLAVKEARGGFWGTALLYAGILFTVSGAVWIGTEQLVDKMFTELQSPLEI